jgi:outer membrane biosynthesis protein TonB
LARNDEGEFELVLGNKQLIGVFLIVVILLGVFFSMGYIVGRNTGPAVSASNPKPILVEHPAVATKETGSNPAPESKEPAPEKAADSKPSPTETHPEQAAAPPPVTPAPVKPPPQEKKEKPSPVQSVVSTPAKVTGEPAPGDYWQVVATSRPDAEIVSETLNKKGFHARVTPAPKREGIFRVIVGPLKDAGDRSQTRSNLEAAGFKPIPAKY